MPLNIIWVILEMIFPINILTDATSKSFCIMPQICYVHNNSLFPVCWKLFTWMHIIVTLNLVTVMKTAVVGLGWQILCKASANLRLSVSSAPSMKWWDQIIDTLSVYLPMTLEIQCISEPYRQLYCSTSSCLLFSLQS